MPAIAQRRACCFISFAFGEHSARMAPVMIAAIDEGGMAPPRTPTTMQQVPTQRRVAAGSDMRRFFRSVFSLEIYFWTGTACHVCNTPP